MKRIKFWSMVMLAAVMTSFAASCGSDDDDVKPLTISPSSVSMKYDESQQLVAPGATSWRSENEFVAEVDQNGLVKGNHIGTTEVVATNGKTSGKCTITITPKYEFFDLPLLRWGASETTIRNAETHGSPSKSGNYLAYKYDNGVIPAVVMYSFKDGALNGILQLTASTYYPNAGLFLIERFQVIGESDGMYIFADSMSSKTAKTIAGLDYMTISSTKYACITYMGNTSNSAASTRRSMEVIPEDAVMILEQMLER